MEIYRICGDNMKELIKYLNEIEKDNYMVRILRWEMDTKTPPKEMDHLLELINEYTVKSFELSTSEEYIKLVNKALDEEKDKETRIFLEDLKDSYEKFKKVPKDFYKEYTDYSNKSLNAWVKAKDKNDYSLYKPYLLKMIDYTKELYNYMYDSGNLYENMVNTFEKGIKLDLIDKLFNDIKDKLIPLIKSFDTKKIKLEIDTNKDMNEKVAEFLLNYIGFDMERGALGNFTHAYTTTISKDDVRITYPNTRDIVSHSTSIIHEGGHGIFEQNVDSKLVDIPTYYINKIALHESQSRFYENILGRNINFWKPIYSDFRKLTNINITLEEFMKYLNNVSRSLIRTEADELTYTMHIIIRYEIERDIFNGNIDLDNLDKVWNQKYKDYLGIDVTDDKSGILQDMHWSDGSFGYFPCYLLGSIFDGMLLEKINSELGNVDELLESGRIKEITKYLNDNIHKYGDAYNINEVSIRLFNKEMTSKPIINYFINKYSKQ